MDGGILRTLDVERFSLGAISGKVVGMMAAQSSFQSWWHNPEGD